MGNHTFTDKKEISNIIDQTISKNSSKDNMSPKFTAYKNRKDDKSLLFTSEIKEFYNEPFTFEELLQSLNNSYDTAVGSDQIHYHLPRKSKECLFSANNQ